MSSTQLTQRLEKIFRTPEDPGALGGAERLYRRAIELNVPGVIRTAFADYLHGQQAYKLHKPARRKYKRNKTYVADIDAQWQADLANMLGLASQNDGMRYILTVIDVFSKYAWSEPVRSKDAGAVADALKLVLLQASPRKPKRLQTDKGRSFSIPHLLHLCLGMALVTLQVKAIKRQPLLSGSIGQLKQDYTLSFRTEELRAGWM